MDRIEKAALLKRSNNCCQAVLLAYADALGLSEEELTKLGKTFGAGLGGMPQAKALHQSFTELCGASVCQDIKGVRTGKVLCSCEDCVKNAVKALEAILHS